MNVIHRAAMRLSDGLKSLTVMVFGRSAWSSTWMWGRHSLHEASQAEVRTSSIVQACVLWISKKLPQSPIRVQQITKDGLQPIPNHPMLALLKRPNPWYSGTLLLWATVGDFIAGNAYWLVVRSGAGRPVELWWVPAGLIEPQWVEDGTEFIGWYDYTPSGGSPIRVETDDVIHFRNGIDPLNVRKGLSQYGALLREVFTDEESARYTAALVRNGGGPGVILAPDDSQANLTDVQVENVKAKFEQNFGGENRGRVMVLGGKTQVHRLGFTPEEMSLDRLRRIPEERITAVLGVPAAVVGLGAGLETTKVGATMAEMREVAYEDTIIPFQGLIADELQAQLLPQFGRTDGLVVDFDNTGVRELQEDRDKLYARLTSALSAGGITLRQYQLGLGMDPDAESDVYYLPGNITPTAPADLLDPPTPRMQVTDVTPALDGQPAKLRALTGGKRALVDKVVPLGAGEPFDALPERLTLSDADKAAVSDLWDETEPDMAGLLDAEVTA